MPMIVVLAVASIALALFHRSRTSLAKAEALGQVSPQWLAEERASHRE